MNNPAVAAPFGILVAIPFSSGIGFAIQRLISAFYAAAVQVTGGVEHVHFCFTDSAGGSSSALPSGFSQVVFADPCRGPAHDMAELCDYVSRHDIAVVFALDLPVQAPTLKSLRAAGARKVISYWGAPMSGLNQGWRLVLKRLEVRLLHRHRPDLFIFESKAMQLHAVQGRGISEDSTMVVNTGIEPTVFRPLPESRNLIYSRLNVPSGRKIVVFMGHLHERKGVHILLDAADILVTGRKRQDVHFVFLGDRPGEAENFREHGRLARKQGFVTFGGYHTNIPELLAGCYLGCVPSSGWDSFPMSPVEMQACGIPVIVSDLQGTPETILDGRTGVVVRAGDAGALANAIESLLDDPAQRDRMSQQARAHVLSTLTVEHQVAGLVTALRKVI